MVFHLYWNYFEKTAVNKIPSASPYYGTLGVLAWAGHTNYWHWLHDSYHLLQLSGFEIDKYVLPPLTLPSVPFNAGTSVKWTIEFLRDSFLKSKSHTSSSDYERIYVSREDASWRKVANESKLMALLAKKGFKQLFWIP